MMNGYSVTEAASVLGVPTERVWELLARGVLAGAPEGETGMRVFLQPRSAPAAPSVTSTPADDAATAGSNGPDRELSPFRELLTEFRSLTERYGQALLALGEARGEVASLRSRVDLLEARIDLRLPMGAPTAAPWPTQPLPVSEGPEHEEEEGHRRRRRGARRATENFAEALARAEDPSVADLPGGTGAVHAADAEDVDRSLPREVLPAEPVLVAEEDPDASETVGAAAGVVALAPDEVETIAEELVPVSTVPDLRTDELEPSPPQAEVAAEELGPVSTEPEVAEPPSIDETETVQLEPPDAEALPVDEESAAAQEAAATSPPEEAESVEDAWEARLQVSEPETASAELPEVDVEPIDIEPPAELAGPDQPSEQASAEAAASDEPPAQAGQDAEEPAPAVEPEAADFDDDRYTTVIEQPDWLEAEADPWPASPAGDETADVEEAAPTAGSSAAEELDAAELAGDDEPSSSEPEAPESGADEMEVAGGGQTASGQAEEAPEARLPGSRELDEALEAFGDLGTGASVTPETEQEWAPADHSALTPPSAERLNEFVARARQQTYGSAIPGSPATRAYRRLRRIFPT